MFVESIIYLLWFNNITHLYQFFDYIFISLEFEEYFSSREYTMVGKNGISFKRKEQFWKGENKGT